METSNRNRIITLDEFILKQQKEYTSSTGELTNLLRDIGVAAKIINREVNKAGLVNILGVAGAENESGDTVQKLDIYANDKLIECLGNSGECAAIASEELENFDSLGVVDFYPVPHHTNFPFKKAVEKIIKEYSTTLDLRPISNKQVITVVEDEVVIVS